MRVTYVHHTHKTGGIAVGGIA